MKARLDCVYSLVKKGDILCDVGSDHGLLPIRLIKDGVISKAIACDINPLPLESGRKNADIYGVSQKMDFVLSDGLISVDAPFTVASVCGMGGEMIIKIITDSPEKSKKRLILQPMTGIEKLRAFLWQNGFSLTNELFAFEQGKSYCILEASYTGENTEFSYADTYLGKIRPDTEEFELWKKRTRLAAEKRLKGAKTDADKSNIMSLIEICG